MTGIEIKKMDYPIPRVLCGAKTRGGRSCRQPAMKNGRCRLHGGKSLSGEAHGRYRHGFYTKEFQAMLKANRQRFKAIKEMIRGMG